MFCNIVGKLATQHHPDERLHEEILPHLHISAADQEGCMDTERYMAQTQERWYLQYSLV